LGVITQNLRPKKWEWVITVGGIDSNRFGVIATVFGTLITALGILVTGVVIFFAFRTTAAAVAEAKVETEKHLRGYRDDLENLAKKAQTLESDIQEARRKSTASASAIASRKSQKPPKSQRPLRGRGADRLAIYGLR
jgi:uncharacterized protein YlxW (UPF0749 family)